jgi:serine/threonine protein kinase
MANGYESPWYFVFPLVLDAVKQILEASMFSLMILMGFKEVTNESVFAMSDWWHILWDFHLFKPLCSSFHLQDLDNDNILINWIGGHYQTLEGRIIIYVTPFQTHFPVRYYLNDFELAVVFDPDSDPSTWVVTGLPTKGLRSGRYGWDPAPEMLLGTPYCLFRADIWQLGNMFKSSFSVHNHLALNLPLNFS